MNHHEEIIELDEPVLRTVGPLRLAGLQRHYTSGDNAGIPAQWSAFNEQLAGMPELAFECTYGVVHGIRDDDSHDYLAAIPLDPGATVPDGMSTLELPVQSYLVFHHQGHIADMPSLCEAIFTDWLPESGYEISEAPFFERYTADFDPETGAGGFEFWLPIETTP